MDPVDTRFRLTTVLQNDLKNLVALPVPILQLKQAPGCQLGLALIEGPGLRTSSRVPLATRHLFRIPADPLSRNRTAAAPHSSVHCRKEMTRMITGSACGSARSEQDCPVNIGCLEAKQGSIPCPVQFLRACK